MSIKSPANTQQPANAIATNTKRPDQPSSQLLEVLSMNEIFCEAIATAAAHWSAAQRQPAHGFATERSHSAVIPSPLRTDRCGPVESAEGSDAAGFGEQGVPGVAARVEKVVIAGPETVREETLAQIQPDPLDRVQLRGVGRQTMCQPARSISTTA
jgi:hypothetical protein